MNLVDITTSNTNNGWGFGGHIGTHWNYDNNVTVQKREICYRHAPSTKVTEFIFKSDEGNFKIDRKKLNESNGRVYIVKYQMRYNKSGGRGGYTGYKLVYDVSTDETVYNSVLEDYQKKYMSLKVFKKYWSIIQSQDLSELINFDLKQLKKK